MLNHVTDEMFLEKIQCRMGDIDDLISEKAIYQRIDENAKQVRYLEKPVLISPALVLHMHRSVFINNDQ